MHTGAVRATPAPDSPNACNDRKLRPAHGAVHALNERIKDAEIVIAVAALAVLALIFRADPMVRTLGFLLLMSTIPLSLETWIKIRYMPAIIVVLIALAVRIMYLSQSSHWRRPVALYIALLFLMAGGTNAMRVWHAIKGSYRRQSATRT